MTPPADISSPEERNEADARLLRRIAAGDSGALSELYDRFSRPLYSAAVRILGDAAEAQDVVHDVFLTLWEKASVFRPERGNAFSWAATLTRNRAIDRLRTRRRRSEMLERSAPSDLGYPDEAEQPRAGDAADRGDRAQLVRTAVSSLPEEQQRALELAYFGGLSQQEIAERLSAPLGTVKARMRRGLARLREALEGHL
jgi:RNA polymerase sigma-70 factor, ECF subfamily